LYLFIQQEQTSLKRGFKKACGIWDFMLTSVLRLLLARRLSPYVFRNAHGSSISLRRPETGMYIHVPFCKTLCSFCPYNKVLYNKGLARDYKTGVLNELSHLKGHIEQLSSIYIGGGTPSLLKVELREVLNFIRQNFRVTGEIALELHPSDTSPATLKHLKDSGVTMVSLGVQSFNSKALQTLSRTQLSYNPEEAFLRVLDAGFKCVDVDLLFGMKGIPAKVSISDFAHAISLGADQVSTYPLIPFKFTPLGKAHFKKKHQIAPKGQLKQTLSEFGQIADKAGYYRSSIWSFTKKGSPKYSSITRSSFVGIGASATSLLGNTFAINTFCVQAYISQSKTSRPVALTCRLNERDEMLFWAFWQCYSTVLCSAEFRAMFGKPLKKTFLVELLIGQLLGLIKPKGEDFSLTPKGVYLFHLIEQEFTHSYLSKAWGTCMNVAWPNELVLR
jgi:menaquinone C8-methyltransferase